MLGLPDAITACLFDMDGVITQTAKVHDAAWKEMFDEFLRYWSSAHNQPFVPFDPGRDYDEYVDGKPRLQGTSLLPGVPGDRAARRRRSLTRRARTTLTGLGNQKNELFLTVIKRDGVQPYEGSVRYVKAAREAGCAPRSCRRAPTPRRCSRRPGWTACSRSGSTTRWPKRANLRGKPAPDTFLEAARLLGVAAANAVVYEDALAGVAAGQAGHFGLVVGVDRVGQADQLHAHGADVVVKDLAELL